MRCGAAVWAGLVLCAACGGAAAESPSMPATEATPSGGAGAVQSQPEPPSATSGRTNAAPPEVARVRGDVDRAEREVGASLGDCTAACRALASMERAADHLCALDAGHDCSAARERVEAARQRVQATCGACSQ